MHAIVAHKAGCLDKAIDHYSKALRETSPPSTAYLNFAALLRQQSKPQEGVVVLEQGLHRYPNEAGLWNNYGNCLLDLNKGLEALAAHRKALALQPRSIDPRLSLVGNLNNLGFYHLAYSTAFVGYQNAANDEERNRFLLLLTETIFKLEGGEIPANKLDSIIDAVERSLRTGEGSSDPAKISMTLCQLWIQHGNLDKAIEQRGKVLEDVQSMLESDSNAKLKQSFINSWHSLSWNLAIFLLKKGRLDPGWKLYQHGLQVPAEGPQKWQRSLKKPFSEHDVTFWRGESLKNKSILLLGEQGIGDSMMFATLIPSLISEGAKIYLLPGDRLVNTYKRSLPMVHTLSSNDIHSGNIKTSSLDFQSPIGSICQYRFTKLSDYGHCKRFLKSQKSKTEHLREKYLAGRSLPLIGISWQGGGKPNRIPLKSVGLSTLMPIFKGIDALFVSLQYGDDGPHIQKFNAKTGCHVIHDDTIDPIADLDGWLSQVDAMDAVVSIANTTIHGAGGLGVPTMCLVSNKSDWRWIDRGIYKGCYWYQSVEATYQSDDGSWDAAIADVKTWLQKSLM